MNKFTSNANLLLFCLVINAITSIFIYTYLLAFIINISNNNIINVAIFYLTLHISMIVFSWALAPLFKRIKKTTSLRLGVLGKFLFVGSIILFQEHLIQIVPLIAICNAFAEVLFWGGVNPLQSELSKNNSLILFTSVSKTLNTITSLVVPIIMGCFIDKSGLKSIAIAMIFCVIIQIALSIFIRDDSTRENTKLEIKSFWQSAQNQNINIKRIYFNLFLLGICSNMSMLILYYTVTVFGSNLSIGIFSSISAVLSIILLAIYNWKTKLFSNNAFSICSGALVVLSVFLLLLDLNKISLVLFYLVWNISIIVPETLSSTYRLNIVKNKNMEKFNIENVTISETFLDSGRIFGEVIILIMAVVGSRIFDIICLSVITLIVPIFFINTNSFTKVK